MRSSVRIACATSVAITLAALVMLGGACGDDDGQEAGAGTPSTSASAGAETAGATPSANSSADPSAGTTDSPAPASTTAAPVPSAAEVTTSNTAEEAIILYVTTVGLDGETRERADPLYCEEINPDNLQPNLGKVCIVGTPPLLIRAVPGAQVTVGVGLPLTDTKWVLTLEVAGGAWTVTNADVCCGGL